MPYAMRLSGWSGLAALAGALSLFCASAHLLVGGLEMLPAGVPRSYPSLGAAAFGTAGRRVVGLLALSEFGGGAIVTFVSFFSFLKNKNEKRLSSSSSSSARLSRFFLSSFFRLSLLSNLIYYRLLLFTRSLSCDLGWP